MRRRLWFALIPPAALAGAATAWAGRTRQERMIDRVWDDLAAIEAPADRFDPAMVDGLPPPAQRYLLRTIAPGTPLASAVLVSMRGTIRLSAGAEPMPMSATQILAPPHGFVWRARVGGGLVRFRGFDAYADGSGRMRWWLFGAVPLVNAASSDISRSAAGRLAGEAVWLPSALLPDRGARWHAMDDETAMFVLDVGGESVETTITVDAEGRIRRASIRRWREDDGSGRPGYVRFDVDGWEGERTFGGYTIMTRFRAGWRLGEADEFAFFEAVIDEAEFR
jgi:hypothetical protein